MNNLSNNEWRMVWECAILSKKSYSEKTVKVGSNSFLFTRFGNYKIISFTGSERDVKDWIKDFQVVKVKRDGAGKIHNGFADSYDDLKKEIKNYVNVHDKIIFTGHSLGGAIACLVSFFFKREGFEVTCITFGQPRVGNDDFKIAFNKLNITMYRFVHGFDIVPTIPRIFYEHVGTVMPIFEGKILEKPMEFGWNIFYRFWKTSDRFEHHEMDAENGKNSYITCLSRIIDGIGGRIKEIEPNFIY